MYLKGFEICNKLGDNAPNKFLFIKDDMVKVVKK